MISRKLVPFLSLGAMTIELKEPHPHTPSVGFVMPLPKLMLLLSTLMIESDANTEVKFLVSKTRVAPLQTQTIPRLELLSAFLLSKLVTSVMESLSTTLPQIALRCYIH